MTSVIYRVLGTFTDIKKGEAGTLLLLCSNIFLLLTAYYIIKPVREALILAGWGAEIKSYLSAAQAVLLVFVVKAYGRLGSNFPRHKLISWVTLFFASNLAVFYILGVSAPDARILGILFFVWVGIFNLTIVAQFWAFANDVYSAEKGKRLFPVVAFGATSGAFCGSKAAGWLVQLVGLYQMLLAAGFILGICVILTLIIHREETSSSHEKSAEKEACMPLGKEGGFRLIMESRYLSLIALLVLMVNLAGTTGEYILGKMVTGAAEAAIQSGSSPGLDKASFIGKFYADFFLRVNLSTMVIQLFLVSRIYKWFGVRPALFFLPVIALGGYSAVALGAPLIALIWSKTLENSSNYSLMETTRHTLFLVTSRDVKYKAQSATDTFFWRAGDVLSALMVYLCVSHLAFGVRHFAGLNVLMVCAWLAVCTLLAREHKKLASLNF